MKIDQNKENNTNKVDNNEPLFNVFVYEKGTDFPDIRAYNPDIHSIGYFNKFISANICNITRVIGVPTNAKTIAKRAKIAVFTEVESGNIFIEFPKIIAKRDKINTEPRTCIVVFEIDVIF